MKRGILVFAVCAGALVLFILGLREARRVRFSLQGSATSGPGQGPATVRFVKNPEPLPEFTLRDLAGQSISPADWRGKVTLLNFWATWCGPCREEIPDLMKLQGKYAGRLQIIGLSVDEGPAEEVKRFAQQMRINYPIAIASAELQTKFGGILGLPTSFLVDTNGRVVQKHIGLRNPALYDAEVRALLGLPGEAKIETFDDTGQIFLNNAKRATEIPGIDLSKLTPEQKKTALRQFNEQNCTCGCGLTLAQCRINDTTCAVSLTLARHVLEKIAPGKPAGQKARPAK